MTVDEIVEQLQQLPVYSIPEAKRPTGIAPEPGFYAWWSTPGALTNVPTTPHSSFKLDRVDNHALSDWQITHLRVGWALISQPWDFETNVIASMQPPMNRDHNEKLPFYESMGDARDRFRDAARATLT